LRLRRSVATCQKQKRATQDVTLGNLKKIGELALMKIAALVK
jgi:hypothetical protein